MKDIFLTGVKPTGTPHIGNYIGAIKPAIDLINNSEKSLFYYFIADYHALTTVTDKETLGHHSYEVAATWLACGLNPEKVVFYKQSDISEIFELATILSNVTPKGLLNRAHAYKAVTEENTKKNIDIDSGVNMGLYNYPVLMSADILLFNTTKVPVGQDQKQHIEIARDIADYFNNRYGKVLVLPEEYITKNVATILGTDGRKMSKSYNNTIKLFAPEKDLEKTIKKIVTDSKGVDEPKGTDNAVYELYKLFATKKELAIFEKDLQNGIGWGQAKTSLFNLINKTLAPLREKYNYYMENKQIIDEILKQGAVQAKVEALKTIKKVKEAIGVI